MKDEELGIKYYRYPGDGYNNWKVIAHFIESDVFFGTTKVYPSGLILDPVQTIFRVVDSEWEELTLEQALSLTNSFTS